MTDLVLFDSNYARQRTVPLPISTLKAKSCRCNGKQFGPDNIEIGGAWGGMVEKILTAKKFLLCVYK